MPDDNYGDLYGGKGLEIYNELFRSNPRLALERLYELYPFQRVYFIQAEGESRLIKIGSSSDPSARLKAIQACSPIQVKMLLYIPGSLGLEQKIQDKFMALKSHNEWFRPGANLLNFIEKLVGPISEFTRAEQAEENKFI